MRSGERPWRRLPPDLFRFATTELRELHTAVLAVFDDAAVLQPALRLEHVRSGLDAAGWDDAVDDDRLRAVLGQLVEWGLLDVTQDHAAHYATPEEFERRNLQWSLTPAGEAAIGGVLFAIDQLRRAVSLQPAVLDAIADGLGDLHRLLSDGPPAADAPRVATTLFTVESHHEAMVASLRQFNRHLQRLLRDDGADDEVFLDVKRKTVEYLQEYVTGIDRRLRRVGGALERLQGEVGVAVVHEVALRGANLAPLAGEDPAPGWLAERTKRWDALGQWFDPGRAGETRISNLLDVARNAVVQLLRVLERRWDARRRTASVADDFRALAGWFATAESEDEAHVLYNAAFGLWPARHAHLVHPDEEAVASTTSWLDAAPVAVAPSLRSSGSVASRGRVAPVADPSVLRARRQRRQAEDLGRHDRIRDALVTGGRVPLSTFAGLDRASFRELLALVALALSSPRRSDGSRRSSSSDGQVEVTLWPPPAGGLAILHTNDGTLSAPDYLVAVDVVGAAEELGEREAAGA